MKVKHLVKAAAVYVAAVAFCAVKAADVRGVARRAGKDNIGQVSDGEWNRDPYARALIALTVPPLRAIDRGIETVKSFDLRFDLSA